jgi:hypothetical protein
MHVSRARRSGEVAVSPQTINRGFGIGSMRGLLSVSAYDLKSFDLGFVLEAGGVSSAARTDSFISERESNLDEQRRMSSWANRRILAESSRDRVKTQDIVVS